MSKLNNKEAEMSKQPTIHSGVVTVASLEFCEELYQLSRWHKTISYFDGNRDGSESRREHEDGEPTAIPAYDLGYLLRKLPHQYFDDRRFNRLMMHVESIDDGLSSYVFYIGNYVGKSSTPEDAACKLAIELFKQGMLNRNAS